MQIGGLQKVSLIDYPEILSCVIFTQGCNFRCRYCHNPELVLPEKFSQSIHKDDVMEFLKKRRGYLEGVVLSGGEPTIQTDIITFLYEIKCLGYLTKLDTNGSRPETLRQLIDLKLINYVAMDVKAPFDKYEETVHVHYPIEKIRESINIIRDSGINHEFRTTVVKCLCSYQDMWGINTMIAGDSNYKVQKARIDDNVLDKHLKECEQYSDDELNVLKLVFEEKQLQKLA